METKTKLPQFDLDEIGRIARVIYDDRKCMITEMKRNLEKIDEGVCYKEAIAVAQKWLDEAKQNKLNK